MPAGAPLLVAMGAVAVAVGGLSIASIAWRTAIQQHIPTAQQGRVAAYAGIAEFAWHQSGTCWSSRSRGDRYARHARGMWSPCRRRQSGLLSRDVRRLRLHLPGLQGAEQANSLNRRE